MASWDEIKKLASDLHRVQLGEGSKKLSERNCIEIIAGLIEKCQINVVFSLDGREYITRDYLKTQIINETLANGGRISLSDLQQILNVQYLNIETEARCIADSRSDFCLCLGQLISRDYFEKVFRETDEKLQENGRLTLSDITKCYDLPTDLLVSEVTGQLGRKIRATIDSIDSSVLYTKSYIETQKAVLRGALSAVTKPIQVCKLITELNLEPGLFFASFDYLLSCGHIKGSLSGGRILDRAVYIPDAYVESTERFIRNFYYQNGYLELATLKKLSVPDAKIFLNRLLGSEADSLHYLKTIVISHDIYEQIENYVNETMKRHYWADVLAGSPISLDNSDLALIVDTLHKKHLKEWTLCGDSLFYQHHLVEKCAKIFEPMCVEKAAADSPNVAKLLRAAANAREQQSLPSSDANKKTKGGGKSKKKGQMINADADGDFHASKENSDSLEFMPQNKLVQCLTERFQDDEAYPADILVDVCSRLYGMLNSKYREHLESVYVAIQSTSSKRDHNEFNDKIRLLYQNIYLFDAGTSIFNDSISEQLKIHLLRTLCTDLVNLAVGFYGHVPNPNQLTAKIRDSTVEALPNAAKSSFQKLVQSLSAKDLVAFYDAVDEISAPNICSLNLKRPDKKIKPDIVQSYQTELAAQLAQCDDPSAGLLLSCLLLITKYHAPDVMVHASGKFVPQIVALLQEKVPKPIHALLSENQKLVVQRMKSKDEGNCTNELNVAFLQLKEEISRSFPNPK